MKFVKIGNVYVNLSMVTHVEVFEVDLRAYRSQPEVRFYLNHAADGSQNYIVFVEEDYDCAMDWLRKVD